MNQGGALVHLGHDSVKKNFVLTKNAEDDLSLYYRVLANSKSRMRYAPFYDVTRLSFVLPDFEGMSCRYVAKTDLSYISLS
jgi:hypothetical protein